LLYGVAVGGTELAIEKLPGNALTGTGMVDDALSANTGNLLVDFVLDTGGDVIGEAGEEGISAILNPYLKRATYNPNAPLATPEDILYQMKVGGVLGGLVGGVANVSGAGVNSNVQVNAGNVNSTNIAVANDADLSAEQHNMMQETAKLAKA